MGWNNGNNDFLEPLLTLGSSAVAEPLAGLYGMFGGLMGGTPTERIEKAREALTYQQRRPQGKRMMQNLGEGMEAVGRVPEIRGLLDSYSDGADKVGDYSPALGAAVRTLPTALGTFFGPGGSVNRAATKNVAAGIDRGVTRAGMAVERALDAPVTRALDGGGLLGEMTQAMGTGTQSNMARMSAAEAIARGYWHPIGDGKKLIVPKGEMTFTADPVMSMPERNIISPEVMLGGKLVPATGDRSAAGKMLRSINGVDLPDPVYLEGGADFMRTHKPYGRAWASDKGVITALSKQIAAAAEDGSDVFMPYTAMGHGSLDHNTMMSDALLEQMRGGKFTKKIKKEFDSSLRALRPEWLGIDHPDARAQLNETGLLRHAFNNRMELDQFSKKGFPDIASTRNAITEPALMDVPLYSSGYAVSKMNPSGLIDANPASPHSTYSHQLAGDYLGGLEMPIPREVMFSDHYNARRAGGFDPSGDNRSFQLSNPIQNANQQWLDGVMGYIEQQRKLLGSR